MSNLRIGVVGAGVMGSGHIEYLSRDVGGVDVVAVAEPDPVLRGAIIETWVKGASGYGTLEEMARFETLDGVVVASPDRFHAASIAFCLERNLPVLCEKPLAETVVDARQISELNTAWESANASTLVNLGFMRRFDPAYVAAKAVLESGEVGRPLYVNASTRNVSSPGISSAQLLTNIAVHEIDTMRWLLGSEWREIEVRKPRQSSLVPDELEDPIVIVGSMENSVLVVADIFANNNYGYDVRAEISCERGVVRVGVEGDVIVVKNHHHPAARAFTMIDNWIPRFRQAYVNELSAWVDRLRGVEHPDLATVADGLAAAEVLQSALADLSS